MPTENRSSNTEIVSVPRDLAETIFIILIGAGAGATAESLKAEMRRSTEQHQGTPVGEVVAFGKGLHEIAWSQGKMPRLGAKLYTHADPGEVERVHSGHIKLEALNEQTEKQRDHWMAECKKRDAQLAERDALLRQAHGMLKLSARRLPKKHQTIRAHIDHLAQNVEAALPASAEPSAPVCTHRFMSLADRPRRCADCDAVEPSAPVELDEYQEFQQACREAATDRGRELDPEALRRRADGSHVNPLTECGWWGWQARAALERKL